jgi:hypothetical protein
MLRNEIKRMSEQESYNQKHKGEYISWWGEVFEVTWENMEALLQDLDKRLGMK